MYASSICNLGVLGNPDYVPSKMPYRHTYRLNIMCIVSECATSNGWWRDVRLREEV